MTYPILTVLFVISDFFIIIFFTFVWIRPLNLPVTLLLQHLNFLQWGKIKNMSILFYIRFSPHIRYLKKSNVSWNLIYKFFACESFFFLPSFNRFSRKLKNHAPILLVSRNYVLTEFLEVWLSCGLALKKLLPPRVARNLSVPLKVSEI